MILYYNIYKDPNDTKVSFLYTFNQCADIQWNPPSHSDIDHKLPTYALRSSLYNYTPAPEKWWLKDYIPIGKVTCQGLC